MQKALLNTILEQINQITGLGIRSCNSQSVGGGCINQAYRVSAGKAIFFVKLNRSDRAAMFESESTGLAALAASHTLRTPKVICSGQAEEAAYLVLEYIELLGHGDAEQAGRQLASLHLTESSRFGNMPDNFIGSTPQTNLPNANWVHFWQQHRLGYQLQLAAKNGYGGQLQSRGERLMEQLPTLLTHHPIPSLLHGDLWSGNLGYTTTGEPVIFDPAAYYGDRETDIAMTELFGGFSSRFHAVYNEAWPLEPGYATRKTLYNLYHILNHLNLFGGGYERQAIAMMDQLLAETRA